MNNVWDRIRATWNRSCVYVRNSAGYGGCHVRGNMTRPPGLPLLRDVQDRDAEALRLYPDGSTLTEPWWTRWELDKKIHALKVVRAGRPLYKSFPPWAPKESRMPNLYAMTLYAMTAFCVTPGCLRRVLGATRPAGEEFPSEQIEEFRADVRKMGWVELENSQHWKCDQCAAGKEPGPDLSEFKHLSGAQRNAIRPINPDFYGTVKITNL